MAKYIEYTFKWENFEPRAEPELIKISKSYGRVGLMSSLVYINPSQRLAYWTLRVNEVDDGLLKHCLEYLDTRSILRPNVMVVDTAVTEIETKPGLIQTIWNFFYGK